MLIILSAFAAYGFFMLLFEWLLPRRKDSSPVFLCRDEAEVKRALAVSREIPIYILYEGRDAENGNERDTHGDG